MNPALEPVPRKNVLPWVIGLGAFLALVTILVLGLLVFSVFKRKPVLPAQPSAVVLPAKTPIGNWSPNTFNVHAPEGVRQTSSNSWSVKGGRAFMQVRRKPDDSFETRFVYPFDDVLSPETITAIRVRWARPDLVKLADSFNLTTAQLDQLQTVSAATDINVSPADRERLRQLFAAYEANPTENTELALIKGVQAMDESSYDATVQRIEESARRVKQIFNAEQFQQLSERYAPRQP